MLALELILLGNIVVPFAARAQNLGTAPQFGQAVQGQQATTVEGIFDDPGIESAYAFYEPLAGKSIYIPGSAVPRGSRGSKVTRIDLTVPAST
jgi:hypothetical protein